MISPNSALPDETARTESHILHAVCPMVLPLARVKDCFLQLTVDPKANRLFLVPLGCKHLNNLENKFDHNELHAEETRERL